MNLYLFGGSAVVSAVAMLMAKRGAYSALWFAVATLSVCGVLVELSASFLAASTIVIYAGAVIVTFIFLLMLDVDGDSKVTPVATLVLPVLLCVAISIGFIMVVDQWAVGGHVAITDDNGPRFAMKDIGLALFGRFLYSIEIAGTLLLVATIGAIAISPKRIVGDI